MQKSGGGGVNIASLGDVIELGRKTAGYLEHTLSDAMEEEKRAGKTKKLAFL
jgi:hypothetical protein